MNSFSMNLATEQILVPRKQRRVYKNLKIQTNKSDSSQALDQLSTQEGYKFRLKRRNTDGCISKEELLPDQNETSITSSFEDLYEIVEKLGEGAHSVVYSCIQKKNRKLFAVKVLKNCDTQRINDIKQTYLIMREMNHRFINKVLNLLINKKVSTCYIISQLCPYKDLRSFIQKQTKQSHNIEESVIIDIMNNLLVCLNYLKEKGVCHRDIKPENILYNHSSGDIKLIDFELAKMKKIKDQPMELWTPIGSSYYRAPQSFVLGYGETVDMWAAGIVAFQLLTKKLPFSSTVLKTVIEEIKNKSIDFDQYILSNEAKNFLKQILQKDPKKRCTPQQALRSEFLRKNRSNNLKFSKQKDFKKNSDVMSKKQQECRQISVKSHNLQEGNESQTLCTPTKMKNQLKLIFSQQF